MLVIISDLHLSDASAAQNVPPEAFGLWLDEVLSLASANGAHVCPFGAEMRYDEA